MARILFTLHPGLGHLHPLVPLARALRDAGHDVRLGASPSFGNAVTPTGLPFVALGLEWLQSRVDDTFPGFLSQSGAKQLQILAGAPARALAADVVSLAPMWRPHLIIRDASEFGGWAAAEELGIPSVTYGVLARMPLPLLVGVLARPLAALRIARGLPTDTTFASLYGRLFLDTAPPALDIGPNGPGQTEVLRIRPVYADDSRRRTDMPHWPSRDHTRPTVLVTLGSVFNANELLLSKILEAVADEKWRVLVALGDTRLSIKRVPRNVLLAGYVPLSRVLPECSVVLCHAGRGTVLSALARGVPVCTIPLAADQPITAMLLTRAGAGLTCATRETSVGPLACPVADAERVEPSVIRQQLHRLLEEASFAERACAIQAEISALPGPEDVARRLECLLPTDPSSAPVAEGSVS